MKVHTLIREQVLDRPPEAVFPFFGDPFNLEAITPPLLRFQVVDAEPSEIGIGTLIQYRLRIHGVPLDWLTRIEAWKPGVAFVDIQLAGPYRLWHHTHTFEERSGATLMRDVVRYALPLWPLGEVAASLARRDLGQIFDFRRDAVARLLNADSRPAPGGAKLH